MQQAAPSTIRLQTWKIYNFPNNAQPRKSIESLIHSKVMPDILTSNPHWALKTALLLVTTCGLFLTMASAWSGPPFLTDDPEPVDYRHSEMYFAFSQVNSQGGKTSTPLIEYNYGALPDLQLSITVPYVFSSPSGQGKFQGMGDVTLGAKYRFLQETESQPMMAIYPSVVTANGDANKGLGNGGTQFFLPVWIQKSWGDWQSYGGGGYLINKAPDAHNNWYFGWELQKSINQLLTVGGEIFHETFQSPNDKASFGFNLGGIYSFDQHNRLLMSAGREATDFSTQHKFTGYIGYGVTW